VRSGGRSARRDPALWITLGVILAMLVFTLAGWRRVTAPGAGPEGGSRVPGMQGLAGGAPASARDEARSAALGSHGERAAGDGSLARTAPSVSDESTSGHGAGAVSVAPVEPEAPLEGTPSAPAALDDGVVRDARVVGRVLDATGGPIAGAKVRVHFEEQALARYRKTGRVTISPAPDTEWSTDAQGRFEGLAPSGGIVLVASAEAYTTTHERARAPAADVVLVLAPGARVSGRVQRGDGSPVSGATLQIKPRGFGRLPIEAQSDEQGQFSVGGVPAGVSELTASAAGLSSAREWLRLTLAEVAAPVVLTLAAAHSVHGVVRAPDGSLCPAGMVRAGGRLGAIETIDADGRYRLDGLDAGTHELSVTCHGVAAQTRSLRIDAGSPASIELNWQLEAGLSVSGSVHRQNGEPFAGAMVWMYGVPAPEGAAESRSEAFASSSNASCNTGADGAFRCGGLRAGWYRVSAGSPTGASVNSEPVRVDAQTEPVVALIVPDAGEVRVRVAGGSGWDDVGGRFARGVFARGAAPFPIPATPRGDSFVFESLALGRWRIAVGRAPSEPGPSAVDVQLSEPGQIIEIELRAPEAMSIGGSVLDAAGEPVPDAWVEASLVEADFPMPYPIAEPALTSSDGRFALGDLPPGRYLVSAVQAGGEARQADVAAGQSDVRLVLEGYGSLSGSVTGADGQPARDFSVLLLRDTPGEPLSVDGERGRWALPWVAPGSYRVAILSSSGGAATQARVSSGNETKLTLRLDPELAGQAILSALNRRP
jgi:hypothetical protein